MARTLAACIALTVMVGCPKKTPPPEVEAPVEQPEREPTPPPDDLDTERVPDDSESQGWRTTQPTDQTVRPTAESRLAELRSEATRSLRRVHFDFDEHELTDEAREILRSNAEWMRRHADAEILVAGHCDERGTVEYNLALGARRARAVRDYLVRLGVPAERLSTVSYGKEVPLVRASNESAWAQNRRAEFSVVGLAGGGR